MDKLLFYTIQTSAAVILLFNKIMLRKKCLVWGWSLGLIGMILITILVYFWKKEEMEIANAYNFTLTGVNLYGLVITVFPNLILKRYANIPKAIISIIGASVCVYIFWISPKSNVQGWLEIGMTIGGVGGTVAHAIHKPIWGWRGFIFAHIITFGVFANKGMWIVAVLQLESLRQARIGYRNELAVQPSG